MRLLFSGRRPYKPAALFITADKCYRVTAVLALIVFWKGVALPVVIVALVSGVSGDYAVRFRDRKSLE